MSVSKILVLMDHKRNQQLLAEWLSQRYTIIEAETDAALNESFDLAIVDGTALDRLWQKIHTKKETEQPLFLPILFMTTRQDIGMVTRHLWRNIDEIILNPIEKIELVVRVEVLLRARRLSLELQQTNHQLWYKINEQHQTEAKLLSANHRFELATQVVNGMIYDWDVRNGTVESTRLFQALTGYEMSSEPISRVWWHSKIHPDDLEYVEKEFQNVLANGIGFNLEYEFATQSGEYICLWDKGTVIRDEDGKAVRVIGFLLDITDRKRAEEERVHLLMREQAARLEAEATARRLERLQAASTTLAAVLTPAQATEVAVEQSIRAFAADAGFATLFSIDDNKFEIIYATGYGADTWVNIQDILNTYPNPVTTAKETGHIAWFENTDSLLPNYADFSSKCPSWAAWMVLPIVLDAKTIAVIALSFAEPQHFSDEAVSMALTLTQQFAQVMERTRLYESEQRERARAEEANKLKTNFLGMISHELRTPLTSIKGFSSTLLAQDVHWQPQEQNNFISVIDEEANRMQELIDQLLDLSRIQAGSFSINLELRTVHDVVARFQAQLASLTRHHLLEIDVPEDLPALSLDLTRIGQVLANLVGNAAKFTPSGGHIRVRAYREDVHVRVDVSDEGSGIPEEAWHYIFEAFRQAKSTSAKGAGLGLAICKGIINAHGGILWISHSNPSGTTFSFTLPLI